jgi:hypothetical protein
MNKPHKHADLIKQWADGAEIEVYIDSSNEWVNALTSNWYEDKVYRVKPKKPLRFILVREVSGDSSKVSEGFPHKDVENYFKIHELVQEHETDWDSQRYEVLIDNNENEYTAVDCLFSCRTLGTIRMSKECAEKLCDMLNNGELEL